MSLFGTTQDEFIKRLKEDGIYQLLKYVMNNSVEQFQEGNCSANIARPIFRVESLLSLDDGQSHCFIVGYHE